MILTEHDDVMEELPAQGSEKPFDVGILPRTPVSRAHFLNAAGIEEPPDFVAVDAVVVTEEVSRLVTEGRSLPELLNDPGHGRMVGGREMNHLSVAMFEDDKHIEKGEAAVTTVKKSMAQETSRWLRRKESQVVDLPGEVFGWTMYLRMVSLQGES